MGEALPRATRDAILAADDLKYEDVEVPEWGLTVRVSAMTGAQRDAFEASILRDRDDPEKGVDSIGFRSKMVAVTVIDEQGERLFRDSDLAALSKKSARVLDRLYEVAACLAGLRQEDADRLAGNSDAQSDGSTTD